MCWRFGHLHAQLWLGILMIMLFSVHARVAARVGLCQPGGRTWAPTWPP
jgi:hypothetical protein